MKEQVSQLSVTLVDSCIEAEELKVKTFDEALEVSFWLHPATSTCWSQASWSDYSTTDPQLTEAQSGGVQDVWNDKFMKMHTSKTWDFTDTHKSYFQRLTQDCLMHLRDRPLSVVSIGLVIELVGQDETGFPSRKHKAKFIRDLTRAHKRRGYCGVLYGVITDLSRIICFRLEGSESNLIYQRTGEGGGRLVKEYFTAFLNSKPQDLGTVWLFCCLL